MKTSTRVLWIALILIPAGCSGPSGDGSGLAPLLGPTVIPTATPTPTSTPQGRVLSGDQALFYGDFAAAPIAGAPRTVRQEKALSAESAGEMRA